MLEKTPEYRKNEMVMLEEFRKRKNMKKYYDLMKKVKTDEGETILDPEVASEPKERDASGPERFFMP